MAQTGPSQSSMVLAARMVLAGRGLADPEEARRFIAGETDIPDPFLFAHMEGAVAAISRAIDAGGRVVVHGDYDADGITATAVMVLGLRAFGLQAEWYLPSRFKEGYGLSRMAVETISAEGPALLITVDCGVNYPDEVAFARERGLEVVVVDNASTDATRQILKDYRGSIRVIYNRRNEGFAAAQNQAIRSSRAEFELGVLALLGVVFLGVELGLALAVGLASSCISGWRFRRPACFWRWWGSRWASLPARRASRWRW